MKNVLNSSLKVFGIFQESVFKRLQVTHIAICTSTNKFHPVFRWIKQFVFACVFKRWGLFSWGRGCLYVRLRVHLHAVCVCACVCGCIWYICITILRQTRDISVKIFLFYESMQKTNINYSKMMFFCTLLIYLTWNNNFVNFI